MPAEDTGGTHEKIAERLEQPLRKLEPQAACTRDAPGGSIESLVATMLTDWAGGTIEPYRERVKVFPGYAGNVEPAAKE